VLEVGASKPGTVAATVPAVVGSPEGVMTASVGECLVRDQAGQVTKVALGKAKEGAKGRLMFWLSTPGPRVGEPTGQVIAG